MQRPLTLDPQSPNSSQESFSQFPQPISQLRGIHITWRELRFDEHCAMKNWILFFFDRGICAWETVRGGGQDGWIHVLPLMVALGFTLFLRLPCREHSIFREVSEALDAETLHADMQNLWFSQGF